MMMIQTMMMEFAANHAARSFAVPHKSGPTLLAIFSLSSSSALLPSLYIGLFGFIITLAQ
jgi:hypothetical protein